MFQKLKAEPSRVSIRAPRVGGDAYYSNIASELEVSIRAPRVGGDSYTV